MLNENEAQWIKELPVKEFLKQIAIVIKDEFIGQITEEENDSLRIELIDNKAFRLFLTEKL